MNWTALSPRLSNWRTVMTVSDPFTPAQTILSIPFLASGAIFDITGTYRYSLWRIWSRNHPRIAFIMLNPSSAGARYNDPTIRRCIQFARFWGFGALEVVNLFAYRTADPRVLSRVSDPLGPDNDHFLARAVEQAHTVIAAWGARGALLKRDQAVLTLLARCARVYCLGLTKGGHPRHPLYVRNDVPFTTFKTEVLETRKLRHTY
jgi:hypothetical protein